MKARPISYKKQMILAKKRGWKTVTRRPIKPQPEGIEKGPEGNFSIPYTNGPNKVANEVIDCPYGKPGDQLYTKENYQILQSNAGDKSVLVEYKADGHTSWMMLPDADWERYSDWKEPFSSKPSLFMYKSLARFWDEITEINIECIQDITAEEVFNEGIRIAQIGGDRIDDTGSSLQYIGLFKSLWQSMYEGSPYDWHNNPFIWVVRYKPIIVNGMVANQKELAL